MFSTIRQGSTLYILEKGQDLNLRVGQCTNIQNNYSTYLGNNTVDITVKCDNDLLEFKQLPAALSTATYNNTIITTNTINIPYELFYDASLYIRYMRNTITIYNTNINIVCGTDTFKLNDITLSDTVIEI